MQFAENGKICLEIVRSMDLGYFDIIFMDNTMPIMVSSLVLCCFIVNLLMNLHFFVFQDWHRGNS